MRRISILCVLLAVPALTAAQIVVPGGFRVEPIASGLNQPVALAYLPDGRLLVVEQRTGDVRLILNGNTLMNDPVLSVPELGLRNGESGLLSIAIDPQWPARPYVYAHYTWERVVSQSTVLQEMRLTRWTATGDLDDGSSAQLTLGSPVNLIEGIPDEAGNHNGGTLLFGPDGYLYFSLGDDLIQCDVMNNDAFVGKVLRLKVDGLGASGPVALTDMVAPGNPFVGQGDIAGLVWTEGLRNPFRMTHDPVDGALFIGDVGEVSFEEISRVDAPGVNLGWPFREGNSTITPRDGCDEEPDPDYQAPIWAYGRSDGRSVIAAFVYRAPQGARRAWPAEYEGDFFFTDFYEGKLRRLTGQDQSWSIAPAVDAQPTASDWATGLAGAGDFTIDREGSIVVVDVFGGTVSRIGYGDPVSGDRSSFGRLKGRFPR